MTMDEIRARAKEIMAPNCRACKVCNGVVCRGEIPGVGAMGDGAAWTACTEFLQSVKLNIDTVYDFHGVETGIDIFGHNFKYPIFISPIGGMNYNYNDHWTIEEYSEHLVHGAALAGVMCATGDGNLPSQYNAGLAAGRLHPGVNSLFMKPFAAEKLIARLRELDEENFVAVGCDIDAAGFSNMGAARDSVKPLGVSALREVTAATRLPFILKGVMTARGAEKAAEAGCAAIVVSTHGGRVVSSAPGTCEVLPEIRRAVGDSVKILVDGGIRSGTDVFKALALGADAVMIGRPFIVSVFGGGPEGVKTYADTLGAELSNVMLMCGAGSLSEISAEMIRLPKNM